MQIIRIFLSSPGDVNAERGKVRAVVDDINHDPMYKDKLQVEVVAWDDPHSDVIMPVTLTPQQAIDLGMAKPSACDICLTIFWARMGTPLDTEAHRLKPDGTPYWSGTEWEYLDAVRGSKENGTGMPIIYLYRRTDEPPAPTPQPGQDMDDAYIEFGTQRKRVKAFFAPLRDRESGAIRGYVHEYAGLDAFAELIHKHLRALVKHVYERKSGSGSRNPPRLSGIDEAVPIPLTWDIDTDGSPFPGLRVFTEKYKPVFFGRSREVTQVIRRMATQRMLVIVGASGSGKSSLVRAGVYPSLGDNALPPSAAWLRLTMRPTARPFLALAEAVVTQLPAFAGDSDTTLIERCEMLAAALQWDPSELGRRLSTASAGQPHVQIVLFIDQVEELFTLAKPDDAQAFLTMLKRPSAYLRLLLTIRSDFYDALLPYLEEELRDATYTLAKPSPLALLEMITRPAAAAGLEFEDELPETIVRETGSDAGALALMAYALDELFRLGRSERKLTFADYAAIGRVEGAISRRAQIVYDQLAVPDKDQVVKRVFRELLTVDERGTATRQRYPVERFGDDARSLVQAFVDARLLVIDGDEVEVAHEALFRNWNQLKLWIAEEQEDWILLRQVRNAAHDWQTNRDHEPQKNFDYLRWPQERLTLVYSMQKRLSPELSEVEQNFIESEQCRLLREVDKTETAHERRRWIGERLATIGDPRSGVGLDEHGLPQIDWLRVFSGGEVEIEDQRFTVAPFYVSKYLVSHRQFQAFLNAPDGFSFLRWREDLPSKFMQQPISDAVANYDNYPRDSVTWYQSIAFGRWINAKYRDFGLFERFGLGNWQIRLPTEWEWQWMAQNGAELREYPWGEWDESPRANTTEAGIVHRSTAVGMYPEGAANCGALDVAGNLWEWCLNDYAEPTVSSVKSTQDKTLRGGSLVNYRSYARAKYRYSGSPQRQDLNIGFRLVVSESIAF